MSNYPAHLKYTKDHEWAVQQGKVLRVGITFHAQEALGDVVYVELPKVGAAVQVGASFGVVESTKAVSELFAPVSGKVANVNAALQSDPAAINRDPYGSWMIEIEPSDVGQVAGLMDAAAYEKHVETSP